MFTSIETITPAYAEAILEGNTANRNVRKNHVDYFVRVIQEGGFATTHQGVAIASDGTLLDGQHRLLAIVKAGIPVRMSVTRGMEKEAFQFIDTGIKRTNGDVTRLGSHTVANIELVLLLLAGRKSMQPDTKTPPYKIEKIYSMASDDFDRLRIMQRKSCYYAIAAYAAYLKSKDERVMDQLAAFMDNKVHLATPSVAVLHQKIMNKKIKTGTKGDNVIVLINAYKHFLPENASKTAVKINFDAAFNEIVEIMQKKFGKVE